MILSVYAVTYASFSYEDGKLYTETKTFLAQEEAIDCQRSNIGFILDDCDDLDDEEQERIYNFNKNSDEFTYEIEGWSFSTKVEVQDYEYFFNLKK